MKMRKDDKKETDRMFRVEVTRSKMPLLFQDYHFCIKGIPRDAKFIQVWYIEGKDIYEFLFSSKDKSVPETKEGDVLPIIVPIFQINENATHSGGRKNHDR